jgi:hypothetical protein
MYDTKQKPKRATRIEQNRIDNNTERRHTSDNKSQVQFVSIISRSNHNDYVQLITTATTQLDKTQVTIVPARESGIDLRREKERGNNNKVMNQRSAKLDSQKVINEKR